MSDTLPIPEPGPQTYSRLEMECAAAATQWDGVMDGSMPNPRGLSRGEFIADRLSRHFDFRVKRE